ncbi:MAG: AAA family ATPase [Woeseiaceae bacterium]|nr:AAA family ATPase [Woeseiaceae bacterium]
MTNYLQHFGLTQPVFKRDTQPYLFVTDQLRQAEREFGSAFDDNYSVLTVSGPIGSGKTTAVTHALSTLSVGTHVIRLGRVRLEPDEVLELLLAELGVSEPPKGTIRKLGALGQKVRELKEAGNRLVVVVEDAARTGADTLSELEVICSNDGGFDIGLILCGDESLPRLVSDDRLKRLAQRVSANLLISRLAVDEMEQYLLTAVKEAGGDPGRILGNDVPALLHILSCGIPRLANKLMEASLKKAAVDSETRVTCALLADVAEATFGITTEIPIKRRSKEALPRQAVKDPTADELTVAEASEPQQHEATALDETSPEVGNDKDSQGALTSDESAETRSATEATNEEVDHDTEKASVDDAAIEAEPTPVVEPSVPEAEPVEATAPPVPEPERATEDFAPPVLEPMAESADEMPLTIETPSETAANDKALTDVVPTLAESTAGEVVSASHERTDEAAESAPEVDVPVLESTSGHDLEDVADDMPSPSQVVTKDASPDGLGSDDNGAELPYLIQDTQPSLAALTPRTIPEEAASAGQPEHEMLPDLDELAAELAASNPVERPEVSIPELPVEPAVEEPDTAIPELPVETVAAEPEAALPELPVETIATEPDAALPELPVETAAAEPDPALPEQPVETAAAEPDPALPELPVEKAVDESAPAMPELPVETAADNPVAATPEPVEPELPDTDTSAPAIDETSIELPKLNLNAFPPTDEASRGPVETTPDEAELISAMAEEHAATEAGSERDIGFEETTVKVADTSTSTLDAQAADATGTVTDDQQETSVAAFEVTSSLDESVTDEGSIATTEPEAAVVEESVPEASVDAIASEAPQDPSLKLEVLEDDTEVSIKDTPDDAVVVHDADRDPTLAQLKPDLDALELALAENFVPNGEEAAGDENEDDQPVPQITLDDSIEEKVAAECEELAKRDAEIAARKKAEEQEHSPKPKSGPSETDVHRMAADLQRANTLEDMDDKLAETLFGDEINQVASQVLKAAREQAENSTEASVQAADAAPAAANGDDPDIKKQFEEVWGQVPDQTEAIDLKSAKPNSGLDMSASQRLATVRALNAGMGTPPPPAPTQKKPVEPKEKPVPIEDQIDISMTNTMKALNIDPEMLEPPKDEEDAPKGGFFSRFRKKG